MSNINNIESLLMASLSFGPSAFSSDNLSPKFRSAQNGVTEAGVTSAAALSTPEQVDHVAQRARNWVKYCGRPDRILQVSLKTGQRHFDQATLKLGSPPGSG